MPAAGLQEREARRSEAAAAVYGQPFKDFRVSPHDLLGMLTDPQWPPLTSMEVDSNGQRSSRHWDQGI